MKNGLGRISATLLFCGCAAAISGCSAVNDFGRFMFGGGTADGGTDAQVVQGDTGPPVVGSDGGDAGDGGVLDAGDAGDLDSGMLDSGMLDAGVDAGDAGPPDGGPPDANLPDTGPTPPRESVSVTGGGIVENASYRLRISVGAPQPMGDVSDGSYRLRVGPVSR